MHDHDLLHRLLRLIYDELCFDAPAGAPAGPKRFASMAGHRAAHAKALALCTRENADTEFVEFVDQCWMRQFEPQLQ